MHQLRRKNLSTQHELLDKYYTKKEVVAKCLSRLSLSNYDFVIEPSAGDGAFFDLIQHPNKVALDIAPEHKDIQKQDWLTYFIDGSYKSVLVVGNPPFGRYHALSKRFIQHALCFPNVQTVAFILPDVYKKHTRQRIIPSYWRIKDILSIGRDSFTLAGADYHVPSSFFVLDKSKGKDLRASCLNHIDETEDFRFSTPQDYDIFVFGASPKKIIRKAEANNRGYFLKSKIEIDALVEKIKSVDWKGNSCANGGVFWLTKTEFLSQYLSYHGQELPKIQN